ncbi:MAG: hypothetical protein BWY76_00672 [bacterium ADurb.Bin429]|nr:MAG: hypothetical protein BWY76_00672 [bacterium ADurb.Bin429]
MAKLTITPVAAYSAPTYPTRGQLGADPEALRRVPRRWQGQAVVLAVLAGAGVVTLAAGTAQAVEKAKIVARLAPLFPLGIERPKLRNGVSIANHNTLTYVLINLHALKRIRQRLAKRSVAGSEPERA